MSEKCDILIEELKRNQTTIDNLQFTINKLQSMISSNPKPIIWSGSLNDLVYLIDVLKFNNYINVKDNEISKLFIYGTKQVTREQIQRTRNRINNYKDPDYVPSDRITNLFK